MPRARVAPSILNATNFEYLMSANKLLLTRQFELFNVLAHVEQAHVYHLQSEKGFLGEIYEDNTLSKHIFRQFARLFRPYELQMPLNQEVYRIHRPFAFINSHVTVSNNSKDLGKVHSHWHPIRRRYDLFTNQDNSYRQFGRIDSPFWSWDFVLKDEHNIPRCYINRHFRGIFREALTDQGQYEITFEDSSIKNVLKPEERLLAIACAISIDFDYFSRHSGMFGTNFQIPRERELPHTNK